MNYNNKAFRAITSTDNGEVTNAMIFHYKQNKNIVTCEYQDSNIIKGFLLGIVDDKGIINTSYI